VQPNLTNTAAATCDDKRQMVARRLPHVWSLPVAAMDFSNIAADEFNDRYDTEHGFETITLSQLRFVPA